MTILPTKGWLPLDFEFDPEPAVVTSAVVRWMEFGSTPLAEPFFQHTIEKLRNASPAAVEVDTSLEAMLAWSERLPAVRPAGFIFHISHCGSTLLANGLKNAPGGVVASEAGAFVRLARWYPDAPSRYLQKRWQSTRRRLFDSLFRLFAHYRSGQSERLVIKFCSLNLFGMRFVRECWPEVPCIVLIREPAEVLVSTLNEKGWLAYKTTDQVRELYGWCDPPTPPEEMPDDEYCARLLARHLEVALESIDDGCEVIDYEDLTSKRIRAIARTFGLDLPEAFERRIFRTYAKDPFHSLLYQDDRAEKRRRAELGAKAAAERWAQAAYLELRARARG